jgi:hypothetical protein
MQILFMFIMALSILTYAIFGGQERSDEERREALATAAQMAVYHRAALDKCAATVCGDGAVDPQSYIPDEIKAGTLWKRGSFVSNYDAGTRTMLTYMKKGFATRASVTYGTVAAALRDQTLGETTTIGQWDSEKLRIQPSYVSGWNVTYDIPSNLRTAIPKDSPVIVNRVNKP